MTAKEALRYGWLNKKINNKQKVFTAPQYSQLIKNNDDPDKDHSPVVKFFDPIGASTWLISEFNPETGECFGLCDLGFGEPELGYVSINELISLQFSPRHKAFRMGIERDLHFKPKKPLSKYAYEASELGRIKV